MRKLLTGLLILWLAASGFGFFIGLGFAGSFRSMLTPPSDGNALDWFWLWAFMVMPWLIIGVVALRYRLRS